MNEKTEIEIPRVAEIIQLGVTDTALAELKKKYTGMVATNDYEETRKGIAKCRTLRSKVEKRRQEIKSPYLEACRNIDKEAKRITETLVSLEDPMKASKKSVDDEKEREKAEIERRKKDRIDRIKASIESKFGMHHFNELVSGTADQTNARLEEIKAFEINESEFMEFVILADQAQATVLAALQHLEQSKRVQEDAAIKAKEEDERLAEERRKLAEETERVRQEQAAEQARIDEEKARLKAEEDRRLAEERAAQDEKDRIEREAEEKEKAEAQAKAKKEHESLLKPDKEKLYDFCTVNIADFLGRAETLMLNTDEANAAKIDFIASVHEANRRLLAMTGNL